VNRTFDFYEYAGVIVPGAILLMGLIWFFPETRVLFSKEGVTFGELGIFIILAYAAGQLTQGIGNVLEWLFWRPFGGFPSVQIFDGKFLSTDQKARVTDALRTLSGSEQDLTKLSEPERLAIVRQVYSRVSAAGQATRVDTFNGNFGLMRGLAASFALLVVAAAFTSKLTVTLAVAALLLLSLQRMYRFGRHYAIELFLRYISLKL